MVLQVPVGRAGARRFRLGGLHHDRVRLWNLDGDGEDQGL